MHLWIIGLFCIVLLQALPSEAATRLGLNYTAEELAIWQQRAGSGPYKSTGDVSTNSPGDWDRIVANKNSFVAAPTSARWNGQTINACVVVGAGWALVPSRTLGETMRDAAFWALVMNDSTVKATVRDQLLAQVAVAGTDWTNTTRWCATSLGNEEPVFEIIMWLGRLLSAYDFIRPSLSAGNQATIDDWFHEAATFFEQIPSRIAAQRWPNRDADNYTSSPWPQGSAHQIVYFGGPTVREWHLAWNNHGARNIRFVGQVGVLVNDTFLINRAKLWFKEFIKYGVFYTNSASKATRFEYNRWTSTLPTLGFFYSGISLGSMITLADTLARNGDTELYDYSTSVGWLGTDGGPKTLLNTVTTHLQHVNHVLNRYGTSSSANQTANFLIDSEYPPGNWFSNADSYVVPGNLYWQDSFVSSIYQRTASGAPGYPASPASSGWNPWTGEWGFQPGVMFQYAQLEGLVDPYATADIPPGAPTSLTAVDDGPTDMNLAWIAPAETGGGIGGYIIERCTGDDCTNFVQVANQSGTGTTYTDPNLTPAIIYNYRVKAYDISTPANVGAASNVAEDDTDAGAPATQQTSQATFQCGYADAIIGTELKEDPDEDCRIVSPSLVRVITGLRNSTGSNPPTTSHHLWCQKNAGAWTEVIDTCDAFDLCYSGDQTIAANQVLDAALLPLGGLIYQEGRAKRSIVPPDQLVVEDGKQVEYLHVLHVKEGLIFGDEFQCCERKAGGVELDACVPATLIVGASEYRNR